MTLVVHRQSDVVSLAIWTYWCLCAVEVQVLVLLKACSTRDVAYCFLICGECLVMAGTGVFWCCAWWWGAASPPFENFRLVNFGLGLGLGLVLGFGLSFGLVSFSFPLVF